VRRYGLSVICEPPEPAGASCYALELARAAAPLLAPDERLVFLRHPGFPAPAPHPRLLDVALPFPYGRSPVRRLAEQVLLPPVALLLRLDLLHCPNHVLPLAFPGPTVLTVLDTRLFLGRAGADLGRRLFRDHVYPRSLTRATDVIAISESAARDVAAAFHVPRERMRVIPLGVDGRFASGDAALGRARLQGTVAEGRPFLLHVGQQEPHKNLLRLVGAFGRALDADGVTVDGARPALVLAGSRGADTAAVEARIEALRLSRDVARLGYVAKGDLPHLYAAARALAYPSLVEGFGLPPLEAAAAGVPVLASTIPVLREVMGDGARLCDPLDEAAIADAIGEILRDERLRASLVERGHARVRAFGWRRTAESTLDVYRRAIG